MVRAGGGIRGTTRGEESDVICGGGGHALMKSRGRGGSGAAFDRSLIFGAE